jgi:hypothetical protein
MHSGFRPSGLLIIIITILISCERLFRILIFWIFFLPVLHINPDQVESSFTKRLLLLKVLILKDLYFSVVIGLLTRPSYVHLVINFHHCSPIK